MTLPGKIVERGAPAPASSGPRSESFYSWRIFPVLISVALPCVAAEDSKSAAGGADNAHQVIEMINQNEALSSEVTRLRGQLEEVLDTMRQSQERQKKIATDLDSRIGRIEGEQKKSVGKGQDNVKVLEDKMRELERSLTVLRQTLSSTQRPVEEDPAQKAYDAAIKAYEAGEYPLASRRLGAFVELFPDNGIAADAWYWLGEALWRQRDYAAAISAEERLLAEHPRSKKSPAAMLLIGKAHLALGDADAAKYIWELLIEKHPGEDTVRKARELLQQLP